MSQTVPDGLWTGNSSAFKHSILKGVTVSIVKMFEEVDTIRKLPLTEGIQETQLYKIGKPSHLQIIDPEILFGKCVLLPNAVQNEFFGS